LNKEKALYTSLNKLKKEGQLFHGYCWIPRTDKPKVDEEMREIRDKNVNVEIPTFNVVVEHHVKPPSLFRNNEFTWAFQEIVNTYGIPSYKEVNPAVFACVTFPFLFGVMFGDMGHGFVLFLVGAIMCIFNDMVVARAPGAAPIFAVRYLFLLMGLFATFCGIVYNDFMAIPIFAFDSCYEIHDDDHHPGHKEAVLIPDCVYPIGIDPTWYLAHNELTYMNSLKMKISVILGVM
jgi:V-type H+-transporting ATPase subunit a